MDKQLERRAESEATAAIGQARERLPTARGAEVGAGAAE
jgi:hypothetical protein